MASILITTSHRPTQASRKFVKMLSKVIPKSIRISRGKYTMDALLLQAIDLEIENIIIVRNKKGNPAYIDVYSVNMTDLRLSRLCTIKICGYKIIENSENDKAYSKVVLLRNNITEANIDENTFTCILRGFNIDVVSSRALYQSKDVLEAIIKRVDRNKNTVFELSFKDYKGNLRGLVLRICPANHTTWK